MRHIFIGILAAWCISMPASAQDVSEDFEKSLNNQGFTIVSTGYTWLRRIVVQATDGVHDREIVIARGSGQVLQDNWEPAERTGDRSRPANPENQTQRTKPAASQKPQPSGRNGPAAGKPGGGGSPGGGGGGGGAGDNGGPGH